jgi:hypothetical protein
MAEFLPMALQVGGGLLGSLFGGDASEDVEESQQQAIAEQQREFELARQFLSPFQQAGVSAIPGLQALGARMTDPVGEINRILAQFQQSPAQRFAQQQATQGVQSQAERLGLLDSGAERGALAKTISGLASQNQQQFLQNVLGEQARGAQVLQNLFGTGAGAAGTLAGGALQTGQGIAGSLGNIGAAQGLGALRQQNIFGSLGGLLGSIGSSFF